MKLMRLLVVSFFVAVPLAQAELIHELAEQKHYILVSNLIHIFGVSSDVKDADGKSLKDVLGEEQFSRIINKNQKADSLSTQETDFFLKRIDFTKDLEKTPSPKKRKDSSRSKTSPLLRISKASRSPIKYRSPLTPENSALGKRKGSPSKKKNSPLTPEVSPERRRRSPSPVRENKSSIPERRYPSQAIGTPLVSKKRNNLFQDDEILHIYPLARNTLIQTSMKGCASAVFNMRMLDLKNGNFPQDQRMNENHLINGNDLQRWFSRHDFSSETFQLTAGFYKDGENLVDVFTFLEKGIRKYGPAIVSISDQKLGGHWIIVDQIMANHSVLLRDPYHGWKIIVTSEAFLKRFAMDSDDDSDNGEPDLQTVVWITNSPSASL